MAVSTRSITKDTRKTSRWLPWGLCLAAIVLMCVGAVLQTANPTAGQNVLENLGLLIGFSSFPVIGALIGSRRPENPLGWLFLFIGLGTGVLLCAAEYAHLGLVERPGSWPGATLAAWVEQWLWYPCLMVIPSLALLLFPTGRPPTARWNWLVWACGACIGAITSASMFQTRLIGEGYSTDNPIGFLPWANGEDAADPLFGVFLGLCVLCLASLAVRYRRADPAQRQQLKLLVLAAAIFVTALTIGDTFDLNPEIIFPLVLWMIPGAIGVAILRHRLFDIDVIINRTLVYGLLTAVLLGSYLLIVFGLSRLIDPVTKDSDIAIAASTLAVAAMFQPLRRRIQTFIDQRFYRSKYDAARSLNEFSLRLRDEVDIDLVHSDVLSVVGKTVQPAHASLWLARGNER